MNKLFVFLTVIVAIISQFIYPDINTWIPFSLVTYIIIGFLAALALFFKLKNNKKVARTIIETVVIFFIEHAVITAIAYLRMVDSIIEEGPWCVGITIFVAIIFKYIVTKCESSEQ